MKERIRLKPHEVELLNLPKNTHNKYRLNNEQYYLIMHERNKGIEKACKNVGVASESVPYLWIKNKNESVHVRNPNYVPKAEADFHLLYEKLVEELKLYAPTYKPNDYQAKKDAKLFVYNPADIHIGKLASSFETGETYNSQIAVKRALKGTRGILDNVKGYDIETILFVIGNDILHIDTPKRTTTSGTPQDTDGMWYDNFLIAKKLYVDIIEILLETAPVHVVYNPSNHDYTHGFFLAQIIETHFSKHPNVTFECNISHRKYYRYFNNLIGTTHGDGAKPQDLPLLMAHESKHWGECQHKYFYTAHLHHKVAKDYMGVCVETLRSISGTDSWHHRNGYQHAPKAVEGFIHDKEHGQIARLTFIF